MHFLYEEFDQSQYDYGVCGSKEVIQRTHGQYGRIHRNLEGDTCRRNGSGFKKGMIIKK